MTKEALKIALEALELIGMKNWSLREDKAITAIKQALANEALEKKAENARELGLDYEPVAFINVEQRKLEWAKYMTWDTPTVVNLPKIPLYTAQPQRTWVGLTDEEVGNLSDFAYANDEEFVRNVEKHLKEKNNG